VNAKQEPVLLNAGEEVQFHYPI